MRGRSSSPHPPTPTRSRHERGRVATGAGRGGRGRVPTVCPSQSMKGAMTYRGLYRGAYSALVEDLDFQQLSPAARHVLLTLRLSPQNNAASMFRLYVEALQLQTGYDVQILESALAELACSPDLSQPWIYRDGTVLWIRNGLRFDPNMHLANVKHRTAVLRAISGLPKSGLLSKFRRYYHLAKGIDVVSDTHPITIREGIDTPSGRSRSRSRSRSRKRRKDSESSPLPPVAPDDAASRPVNPGVESAPGVLDRDPPSRGHPAGSRQAVHIGSLVNGALPRQPIGRYGEILQRVQAERQELSPDDQSKTALAEFDHELKSAPR